MKVVIQCASRKNPSAGSLVNTEGQPVLFVANPSQAPESRTHVYARPDDPSDDGRTWRARLLEHNGDGANALGLLPAYRLYERDVYGALVRKFGAGKVFILSAGWGLIAADFLTPLYDITFTGQADAWKRRRKRDRYEDFGMLPDDGEEIVFLGGKDYLRLLSDLTESFTGRKIVFFNSEQPPLLASSFRLVRYPTSTKTNWHYECARDLIDDNVGL